MLSPYLTPSEARVKLGISRRTLARRLAAFEVPGVRLARGVVRIEAHYVDASIPEPELAAASLTLPELAAWLRVRVRLVRQLVRQGRLALENGVILRRSVIRLQLDLASDTNPERQVKAARAPAKAPAKPPTKSAATPRKPHCNWCLEPASRTCTHLSKGVVCGARVCRTHAGSGPALCPDHIQLPLFVLK